MQAFEVLAEPHRRRILDLLREEERPVGELVGRLAMSQPAVSKHLRILREAGMVEVRTDAQRRLYRLQSAPLREVEAWLEPYRRLWAASLERLEDHLDIWATRRDAMDDGTLAQVEGRWHLRFVRRLAHPPAVVWRALTEPEHLAAWFPARIDGERVAGAHLRFVFEHGEGPDSEGEIVVYDPPARLELRWGSELLRFDLEPDGDGCLLSFVDVFDELGKAARDGAGWHTCLDLLEHDLRGDEPPWTSADRWAGVHPGYVKRFGPEAARIGPPQPG